MRRYAIATLLLVVSVAACGDDDAATTTTTAAATTTTAGTTTTGGGTTVVDQTAARVAAALALAGDYSGDWHNITFGSTGSIDASLTVDEAAATAQLILDLGGNVFGVGDPDPFTVDFDLSASGPYEGTNDLLGEFSVEAVDGVVTLTAPAVPGLGGMELTIEATVSGDEITGTYDIPGLANGDFVATRT